METNTRCESLLLTGGLGYIGSITTVELYKFLQAEGKQRGINYKIIIIDNLANSRIKVVDRINQCISFSLEQKHDLDQKYFDFHEIDILNLESIQQLFQSKIASNQPIKYVIHFAGLKAVGESVAKPLFYFQNNIQGTMNICQAMEKNQCQNMIFSSSATVYAAGENLNEESNLKPSNPYGETKLCIEYLIRSIQKANGGRTVSLRYFNPVGAISSGLLGDSPSVFPNNLFPFIEQVVAGNRPHLNIFGKDYPTPDGTGVRDYIHVVDLALGHIAALKKVIEKNENQENWYENYNLGSGNGYSVLQVVEAYSKALGQTLPHQFVDRRPGDVATLTANSEKAKQQLGWSTTLDINQMCQDSLKFITQNPKGIQ